MRERDAVDRDGLEISKTPQKEFEKLQADEFADLAALAPLSPD